MNEKAKYVKRITFIAYHYCVNGTMELLITGGTLFKFI